MTNTTKHVIDVRFPTRVEKTDRVIDIAESFGIGLADGEFVIFDKYPFSVTQGDRIYITGQSGSGKSTLLRELSRQLREAGKTVADFENTKLDPDLPLIDQLGRNTTEANGLLVRAGITDAYLFVRKPGELSDGQRYRAYLAKILETKADVWVADEFGAVLDRPTAKAVAYNIARASMKENATLIVATTHTDLRDEIGATRYFYKQYAERKKLELDPDAQPLLSENAA